MHIFKWFKRLREEHEDLEDFHATGSHRVPKSRQRYKTELTGSQRPLN
jgi:hypothetical protein